MDRSMRRDPMLPDCPAPERAPAAEAPPGTVRSPQAVPPPRSEPEPMPADDALWRALLEAGPDAPVPDGGAELHALYAPLLAARRAGPFAIAHLAQSLDGRIATTSGLSHWLSGEADLVHTHRMRALADAVIVGVGTVLHDDPQLTVRRCSGRNPVRVVIDPDRRLDGRQRVFRDGAAPTLVLAAHDRCREGETLGHADVVPVPRSDTGLDPHAIRRLLEQRGLATLFIEGGGVTVSRFLGAGALDRLQITVVPMILGSGRPSIRLPEVTDLRGCLRPRTRRLALGDDVLFECDFRA
jgi:riboflavin-specific deaminase-like protein